MTWTKYAHIPRVDGWYEERGFEVVLGCSPVYVEGGHMWLANTTRGVAKNEPYIDSDVQDVGALRRIEEPTLTGGRQWQY